MDAQPRSLPELQEFPTDSLFDNCFDGLAEPSDDNFPSDLSSLPECRLIELSDTLFIELDSEMPDLRTLERYQTVCDELTLRQNNRGVA
ncbi:hypothetical protein [Arthrobacter subterraneus]|uniref:hypothetical protein n=1 Tax=Arthrobacter subterraneus TaxID=335973 RepID=UPI0037FD82F4